MNKRLYRSTKDRMIGGVAAGLAEYFQIDPTIVRVIFVVTLFLGGSGVLAYLILWIVVPEDTKLQEYYGETDAASQANPPDSNTAEPKANYNIYRPGDRSGIAGIILIIIGLLFLLDNFLPRFHFGDFWPLILIGIGAGLLLNSKK